MVEQIKIGVLSDTHFYSLAEGVDFIQFLLENFFNDVDAILHAGDLVHPDVPVLFGHIPFYCVRGNMDSVDSEAPVQRVIELAGHRIGLIHGWGDAQDLEERLLSHCEPEQLDCLVYGHSHLPVCHTVNSILVMNPGSATDRRRAPWHSVGMLYVGQEIRGEIINIDVE